MEEPVLLSDLVALKSIAYLNHRTPALKEG